MTLELQHDLSSDSSYLPASPVFVGFHRTAHTKDARISSPYTSSSGKKLLTAFCGALLAITLAGCGSYSSKKTYPTTTQNSSPALWVANSNSVLEFSSTELTTAGVSAAVPTLVLNSSAFAAPQAVVFDTSGNLWVVDGGTMNTGGAGKPALYQFTSANLSALQSPATATPSLTISSSAFTFPQQAVFDSKGNLWVSDSESNAVFEFMASQLKASGAAVTPNITIKCNPAFNGALGIAFDSAGNLWVANNGTTTIFEFNAAALPTATGNVTLTPNITLSDDGKQSIQKPWALAFDSSGNLWASNASTTNTVVQFSKASLAATGSPTPVITLNTAVDSGNSSMDEPKGIAFDNTGELSVVSSAAPFGVGLYTSAQLAASGAVTPNVFIVGAATTLNAPAGAIFGPTITYGSSGTYGGMPY